MACSEQRARNQGRDAEASREASEMDSTIEIDEISEEEYRNGCHAQVRSMRITTNGTWKFFARDVAHEGPDEISDSFATVCSQLHLQVT